MGGACSTYGGEVLTGFWWGDLGEGDHSEDIGIDSIKMHLKERDEHSSDCTDLYEDREKWRDFMNVVMNIRVP